MRAVASARAERRGGRSELVVRRAEAPLSWRWSDGRALLASSAAHPVGGDDLEIHIDVGEGAHLAVGTVAATLCWPGPHGDRSATSTRCRVAEQGRLDLVPEPTVAVTGCRHRASTRVSLAAGAACSIIEEIVLGRTGEASGEIELELRVEREGRPIVHHAERFGVPGSTTAVSVGGARHVLTAVLVGDRSGVSRTVVDTTVAGAWLPVADDAALLLVVGIDRPSVRRVAERLMPEIDDGPGLLARTAQVETPRSSAAPGDRSRPTSFAPMD